MTDVKVTELNGEVLFSPTKPNAKVTALEGEVLYSPPRPSAKVTHATVEVLYSVSAVSTQNVIWTDHSGGTYWALSGDSKTITTLPAADGSWTKASAKAESYTWGKWYFEVTVNDVGSAGTNIAIGIAPDTISDTRATGGDSNAGDGGRIQYFPTGQKRIDGTYTAFGDAYTTGDVIGMAVDCDNGTVTAYKNGVSQGVMASGLDTSTAWVPHVCVYTGGGEFQLVDTLTALPDNHTAWGTSPDSSSETRLTRQVAEVVSSATGSPETRLTRQVAEVVTNTTGSPETRLTRIAVEVVTSLEPKPMDVSKATAYAILREKGNICRVAKATAYAVLRERPPHGKVSKATAYAVLREFDKSKQLNATKISVSVVLKPSGIHALTYDAASLNESYSDIFDYSPTTVDSVALTENYSDTVS